MAIDALHAWHVAMRWTAPFPFPSSFHERDRPSIRPRRCTGGRRGGGQYMYCVLLPSPLLPFTVCVRSLSGVLRWAGGGVRGGLRLL